MGGAGRSGRGGATGRNWRILLSAASLRVTEDAGEPRVLLAEQSARNVLARVGGQYLGRVGKKGRLVAISPDSRWLAIAGEENEIRLWDLKSASPETSKIVFADIEQFSTIQFGAGNRWLVTGGASRTMRLWKLDGEPPGPALKPVVLGDQDINPEVHHQASRDGHWLAAYLEKTSAIAFWDLTAVAPASTRVQLGHEHHVNFCFVGSHGLFAAGKDGRARLWNLQKPEQDPVVISSEDGGISKVDASADGRKLVTMGTRKIRLWRQDEQGAWKSTALDKVEETASWMELLGGGRWLLSGNLNGSAYTSLVDLDAKNPAESYFVVHSYGGPVGCAGLGPERAIAGDGRGLRSSVRHGSPRNSPGPGCSPVTTRRPARSNCPTPTSSSTRRSPRPSLSWLRGLAMVRCGCGRSRSMTRRKWGRPMSRWLCSGLMKEASSASSSAPMIGGSSPPASTVRLASGT